MRRLQPQLRPNDVSTTGRKENGANFAPFFLSTLLARSIGFGEAQACFRRLI
jgi:hypothetical protein